MSTPTVVEPSEFAARRERLVKAAVERGLGGVVVFSRGGAAAEHYGDVAYLADHVTPICQLHDTQWWAGRGCAVLVMPAGGPATLITDNGDWESTRFSVERVRFAIDVPRTVADVMAESEMSRERIGLIGKESLLHHTYVVLSAHLDGEVAWEHCDDILHEHRLRKSDAELALMREASVVGTKWASTILEAMEPGRTEGECIGEGMRYLATQNAKPYDIAMASGPSSCCFGGPGLPYWDTERPFERGDLVHFDAWGPVNRYFTDLARSTVIGGNPSASQKELLDGVVELIDHIMAGIRPGVEMSSLFRRGEGWMVDHGYLSERGVDGEVAGGLRQFPAFGHSLGLGVDLPYITPDAKVVLEQGMVLAVESMLVNERVGGVQHEENVIVTQDGFELLTGACGSRWY